MIQEKLFCEPVIDVPKPALYQEILAVYESEERQVSIENALDKVTYTSPVNFRESMHAPRHRWFPYKEGFSPSFVQTFLKDFAQINTRNVLDPFGGVGTTLIESSRLGFDAFGFEVSPMSHFIASTKAEAFDLIELTLLDTTVRELRESSLQTLSDHPESDTVVSYFEPNYLDALLRIKAFYSSIKNAKVSALFKLAFLNCLERYSTHRKAGNGVKRKTKLAYAGSFESPLEQVRNTVIKDLLVFRRDLDQELSIKPFDLVLGSCLNETLYPENVKFDAVLTSPPYANCFDYSKIYMVELWLGDFFVDKNSQKQFRSQSLRSHVHARWTERHREYGSDLVNNQIFEFLSTQKLWSNQIPAMLAGYFADMGYLLHILSSKCNAGAPVGIVVGNSYYGSLPIATDLILSMLGRQHGFETVKISVYRNVVVSSQQFTQATDHRYMRESLVVLKKK